MNTQLNMPKRVGWVFLFLSGVIGLVGFIAPSQAATIAVTTTLDENDGSCLDDDCSLRDALATAVYGDTIHIPSGDYVLTQGQLLVDRELTLDGAVPAPVIDGNAASRVLEISGMVALTLQNVVLTNGSDVDGGGVTLLGGGQLTLINSEIRGNRASGNGGGVYLGNGGTIHLISGGISHNTATVSGGGVYNMNGLLLQTGGLIEGNSALAGGGVFVNLENAVYTLSDGLAQFNTATSAEAGGGAVYVAAGTVMVNGGEIVQNSGARGGAIQSANGQVVVNGGTIRENTALYGGGIYLTFPEAFLTQNGGQISRNESTSIEFGGGGVYGFQGNMALTGGEISDNTAVADGAGINIRFGVLTVTGGTVHDNVAGRYGGGIFADFATLSVTDLQLGSNTAVDGAGLYLAATANLGMTNTAVYSNTASANGGGLMLLGSTTLTNTTVSGNQAQANGGGLWLAAGTVALENVTIAGNEAANGGGLYNENAVVILHNTLVAGNTAVAGPDCGGSSYTSGGYNLIQDATECTLTGSAAGDILGEDPQLEALTLAGATTYLHPLSATSPAVEAGDPAVCPGGDQHNRLRPMDGNSDGTAVCDIGAFEYGFPLRVGDVTVAESATGSVLASFPVRLDFAAPVTITVAFASGDQTAVAGLDYTAVAGTLTFAPGQTSQTVAVPILDDGLDEAAETFGVTLSDPVNAFLAEAVGVGTIDDNDAAPTLAIQDASLVEGDRNSQPLLFTVTLDAPSGQTVQVSYATGDGTAVAGVDYTAVSGVLTLAPGQTSGTISVPVLGDLLPEQNETFIVLLSSSQNATLGRSQVIGTIVDNEPATPEPPDPPEDPDYLVYLPVVVRP